MALVPSLIFIVLNFLYNFLLHCTRCSTLNIFLSLNFAYLISFPESPRWLIVTGRTEQAVILLEKAAKRNKMPTDKIAQDIEEAQRIALAASTKKGNIGDLFKHAYLCQKTLAMAFNWLVVCFVYYGLSQYMTSLSGNIFFNIAVSALLGIPGTCLCVPATKYMGRRLTLFLSNLLSAISLSLLAFIPSFSGPVKVTLATMGLFGAAITFPNVYLYAGELFPTVVRPTGVGFCSFVGRFGSIVAPWVEGLKKYYISIPPAIFGLFAFLAAASVFLMPETKDFPLPETIEDGNTFGRYPRDKQNS